MNSDWIFSIGRSVDANRDNPGCGRYHMPPSRRISADKRCLVKTIALSIQEYTEDRRTHIPIPSSGQYGSSHGL